MRTRPPCRHDDCRCIVPALCGGCECARSAVGLCTGSFHAVICVLTQGAVSWWMAATAPAHAGQRLNAVASAEYMVRRIRTRAHTCSVYAPASVHCHVELAHSCVHSLCTRVLSNCVSSSSCRVVACVWIRAVYLPLVCVLCVLCVCVYGLCCVCVSVCLVVSLCVFSRGIICVCVRASCL